MTVSRAPRLGIGVTTYNRRRRLAQVLEAITAQTRSPHLLLVADDGSTDETVEYLRAERVPHIAACNRGVAWNKNRLLFHLGVLDRCDVVLLLEDDTVPHAAAWEAPWLECAARYGHMNYAGPWMTPLMTSGAGTPGEPYRAPVCSGQCVVFSRPALRRAGYMDTRFGRYGFEHGEHTARMIRAGFGGDPATGEIFLIESDVTVFDGGVSRFDAEVASNGKIYEEVQKDTSGYRPPFRNRWERAILAQEMRAARLYAPSRTLGARARSAWAYSRSGSKRDAA